MVLLYIGSKIGIKSVVFVFLHKILTFKLRTIPAMRFKFFARKLFFNALRASSSRF
jgi:hypothetical protein